MSSKPNLYTQLSIEQIVSSKTPLVKLQQDVDKLYGKQPPMNRWRLAMMLHTHGKPMRGVEWMDDEWADKHGAMRAL